ncbi:MAG: polysaccharide deacetylase family protein [Gammaproteobacteria bacterium]
MSLPDDYLRYPHRRHGMDQDWYAWRPHFSMPARAWPNGARMAVWICTSLEFFPLNPVGKPFKAPGSMVTAYPDLRHFTTRDYGNRVGAYRLLRLFDDFGLRTSFAVNSAVAARYPQLIADLRQDGHEVIAHGVDMDRLHHGGLDEAAEGALVDECLATLREAGAGEVRGWLSPARCESPRTTALLAARGLDYFCDFVNDELPYEFDTGAGTLLAMPHSHELSDRQILVDYRHSEAEYAEQVRNQFTRLLAESEDHGRRILSLPLTPYIVGLPFRFGVLRELLRGLASQPGVWFASGGELAAAWRAPPSAVADR